MLKTHVKNLKN